MTFRARPTTKPTTRRRGTHAEDARRNLYFNLGFGLIVVVAILLLVGAGAATWIGEHWAAVATVNGVSITKDQLNDRVKIESFKLSDAESRTRQSVQENHISAAQGQQVLQYIAQQQQQISSVALEDAIDTELILQLGTKRAAVPTDAAITAQVTTDATTVESRHVFQIQVVPEVSAGATTPTAAQVAAAQAKANSLLADLKAGKTWENVVKESGDATAAANNGDLLFVNKGSTTPDEAFVNAFLHSGDVDGAVEMRAQVLDEAFGGQNRTKGDRHHEQRRERPLAPKLAPHAVRDRHRDEHVDERGRHAKAEGGPDRVPQVWVREEGLVIGERSPAALRRKRQLKAIEERVDEQQNEKQSAGQNQQQHAVDAAIGQTMFERAPPAIVPERARYRAGGGRHKIASVGAAGVSAG